MNTVLIGGSDDTRSCTSAEDGPRGWASRASCEVKEGGVPNIQCVDPGGMEGTGEMLLSIILCCITKKKNPIYPTLCNTWAQQSNRCYRITSKNCGKRKLNENR